MIALPATRAYVVGMAGIVIALIRGFVMLITYMIRGVFMLTSLIVREIGKSSRSRKPRPR